MGISPAILRGGYIFKLSNTFFCNSLSKDKHFETLYFTLDRLCLKLQMNEKFCSHSLKIKGICSFLEPGNASFLYFRSKSFTDSKDFRLSQRFIFAVDI